MISDEYSVLMTETDEEIPEVRDMYGHGVMTESYAVEAELLQMTEERRKIS